MLTICIFHAYFSEDYRNVFTGGINYSHEVDYSTWSWIENLFILLGFQLPNVTAGLQSLSELTSEGIEEEVLKGKKELEKIQNYVQISVENKVPLIMENIKKTGKDGGYKVSPKWHKLCQCIDLAWGNKKSPVRLGSISSRERNTSSIEAILLTFSWCVTYTCTPLQ